MKKNYQSIVKLSGIVFLLTLLFTPVVSAQPAMQYLNIIGTAFSPLATTETFGSTGRCIYSTGADYFSFPVLLPRGSLIKYLEFFYHDAVGITNTTLSLRKLNMAVEPVTSATLASLSSEGSAGKGSKISPELNITVETNCAVDPQCFYILNWYTLTPSDGQRLCGARIHYIPPFGALALPLVQRN
jgi:hypothetical protein